MQTVHTTDPAAPPAHAHTRLLFVHTSRARERNVCFFEQAFHAYWYTFLSINILIFRMQNSLEHWIRGYWTENDMRAPLPLLRLFHSSCCTYIPAETAKQTKSSHFNFIFNIHKPSTEWVHLWHRYSSPCCPFSRALSAASINISFFFLRFLTSAPFPFLRLLSINMRY